MLNNAYHYQPDVFAALAESIPLICRSKKDVLTFFRGTGLNHARIEELERVLLEDRDQIKKHLVTKELLELSNRDDSNDGLRIRREIVKRVVQFNNFESCWDDKMLAAKGAVAKVRELVNEKDAFTRMENERDNERKVRAAESEKRATEQRNKIKEREDIKRNFYSLYTTSATPRERGLAFEKVLNKIFSLDGLLVREAFTIKGDSGEGIIEQIDGVVELDNHLYLVEAKWWTDNLGVGDVSQHMVRVASRAQMRGFYVVNPGFAPAAILTSREALQRNVFVLATTQELFILLEHGGSVSEWMRTKVRHAMIDKDPHRLFTTPPITA